MKEFHVIASLDGYIAASDASFDAFAQAGDHIDALIRHVPETLPGHVLSALGIEPLNDTRHERTGELDEPALGYLPVVATVRA